MMERRVIHLPCFKLYFLSFRSSWKSAPAVWVTCSESQERMRRWRRPQAPGPQHGRGTAHPFPEKTITLNAFFYQEKVAHPKKWWKIGEGLQLDHHHLERLKLDNISLIFYMAPVYWLLRLKSLFSSPWLVLSVQRSSHRSCISEVCDCV